MQFKDEKIQEPLKTRGFHFFHLNVKNLLSKIDEARDIKNYIKSAILDTTKSKLDSFVSNAEANINGYIIIRNGRNRDCGVVACYIRNDLCFDTKNIFSNSIEYVFFRKSHPKS